MLDRCDWLRPRGTTCRNCFAWVVYDWDAAVMAGLGFRAVASCQAWAITGARKQLPKQHRQRPSVLGISPVNQALVSSSPATVLLVVVADGVLRLPAAVPRIERGAPAGLCAEHACRQHAAQGSLRRKGTWWAWRCAGTARCVCSTLSTPASGSTCLAPP